MSVLKATMRAAQVSRPSGPLELIERPIPDPGPRAVRIKVQACGVCHSDVFTKEGQWPGITFPRIPGHEAVGVIDAVGQDVPERWQPGQRVGVGWHAWHCFSCDNCRRGDFFACQAGAQVTGISFDGGYADYLVAPATALARVPADLPAPDATLSVKTIQALYYKAGGQRLLTIVLVRDTVGKRHDQMFYCTCLDWDARTILSHYACRWSIEVTFEHSKQLLGLEDPANRLPKAVERTAPMALVLYSLIVAWFHRAGHKHVKFPDRPWYTKKAEPSFGDALTTLRRLSCQDGFRGYLPRTGNLKTQVARLIEFVSLAG